MTRRVLAQFLIATAALDAAALLSLAQSPPGAPPSVSAVPATDVPSLQSALTDPNARPDQREQAAQRLLSRPDPAARAVLREALIDAARPPVQVAAARALAATPVNDPTLISPLFALLDGRASETQLDAAARALTAYKGNADVLTRLLGLAAGADERVRVVVIRTVGTFPDQRAAAALVPLTDPAVQPPRVTIAAADALAYLTGFDAATVGPAGWQDWWSKNQAKSEVQFQADLAAARSSRYDRTRADYGSLQDEVARMLADDYQRKPREQKADTLLRYMKSPDPGVRSIGCRIARQAAETDLTPLPVKEQLRTLVGDASVDVRRRAAGALALINDADAVVPILTQLAQEPDSAVRAALADAVRPTRDERAVPLLLKLLDDPSVNTAQSAAEALGEHELGQKLRRDDPALADAAAEKLRATLVARTSPVKEIDFRNDLVLAIAPMQSPALGLPLERLLSSRAEAPKVRRSLLEAIGDLRDPRFVDAITPLLGDADVPIRLAAINALGQAAEFSDIQGPLANLIDPAKEPNKEVNDAAWKVLSGLFPKAPAAQLPLWEVRLQNDPVKLLVVLREERGREQAAGNTAAAATKDQQIGDYAKQVNLYADAISAYTNALAYFEPANMNFPIEGCGGGLLEAYLRNRQFDKGIDFAQTQIREDSNRQGYLGPVIKREAERLVENKENDSAFQLIDMALKIPQLKRQFTDPLQQLRAEVQRRSKEQNLTPYPPTEQAQNALAG